MSISMRGLRFVGLASGMLAIGCASTLPQTAPMPLRGEPARFAVEAMARGGDLPRPQAWRGPGNRGTRQALAGTAPRSADAANGLALFENVIPGWPGLPAPTWATVGGWPVPILPGLVPAAAPTTTTVPAIAPKSHCGRAKVGNDVIPLDCWSPTYGLIPGAAQALPSVSSLRERAITLPAEVDHRNDGEGPVRNQGTVAACTAFSLATAVDRALFLSTGRAGEVSAKQIWSRYHTPDFEQAAAGNRGRMVTTEGAAPWNVFSSREACSWTTPCGGDECLLKFTSCGEPVDPVFRSETDASPFARITGFAAVTPSVAAFKTALAGGSDLWIAMHVPDDFGLDGYVSTVVPDFDARGDASGHAMVIAGYRTQTDGTYFLLHNSFGVLWGDWGYAWIHESTLMRNLEGGHAYVVGAGAAEQVSSPTPSPAGGHHHGGHGDRHDR